MHVPTDVSTWLQVIGALAAGAGSILLAWRVREILHWVVLALVTHERSIEVLLDVPTREPQRKAAVVGAVKHLLDIEAKLGLGLLITGFALLSIGMLANALSHFL